MYSFFFFFNDTATTEIYTLSLHDALPILNLEDIDWENARITIRSKGGRWAQLPLPTDVGEALALYLRHGRSEEHTSELQSRSDLVCRLLLEKKKKKKKMNEM